MALRLGGSRLERRHRGQWRNTAVRLLAYAALVGLVSWWAYDMGRDRAAASHRSLDERLAGLEEENRRLREDAQTAEAVLARAEEQLADIRRRYRAEAPSDAERDLLATVRQRIGEGVAPERIVEVVSAVQAERRCAPEVRTRRFLLRTPVSPSGGGASVQVADGGFVVTGAGASAVDAGGSPEAWFDVAEPVRIAFARPGGAERTAEGVLPLHHSEIVGDKIYNFSLTTGASRGFVNISEQVCAYP